MRPDGRRTRVGVDLDLAGLGLLAHRDRDCEHAVAVGGGDALGVDPLAEVELTQEARGLPLAGDPLDALAGRERALSADRQQLTVDVDVHRAGVDAGKVCRQDVVVAVAVEVHRHPAGTAARVEEARRQTVEVTAIKEGGPSLDWLNAELGYLQSSRGKAKVRAWFNALQQRDTIARKA